MVANPDAALTHSLNMTQNQIFTLYVTNRYFQDCQSSDTVGINVIGGEMTAYLYASDSLICENETTQLFAIAQNGTGNYSYRWEPETGLDDPYSDSPIFTPYEVSSSVQNFVYTCYISDSLTFVEKSLSIQVLDFMIADAGEDQTVVYNTSAELQAVMNGENHENFSFSWEPAELVLNPDNYQTTTLPLADTTAFVLTVSNINGGCLSQDTIVVSIKGADIFTSLSAADTSLCDNSQTQLFAEVNGGTGNFTYSWQPAELLDDPYSQSPTFIAPDIIDASESFRVYLTVSDEFSSVQDSISLFVFNTPNAEAFSNSYDVNYGETATLMASAGSGTDTTDYIFRWEPAEFIEEPNSAMTNTTALTQTKLFTVNIANKYYGECTSSDTVMIHVIGGDLFAMVSVSDDLICENENTQLSVIADGGTGNFTYLWTPDEGLDDPTSVNPIFTPLNISDIADTIQFVCTVSDSITFYQDSVSVVVLDYLDAEIGTDTIAINYGELANLEAILEDTDPNNFIFNWSPGELVQDSTAYSTQTTILTEEVTTFTLTVSNKLGGCISSDTVNVVIEGGELEAYLYASDTTICENETTQLFAEAINGIGNISYLWIPSEGLNSDTIANPIFTPNNVYNAIDSISFICYVNDGFSTAQDTITINIYDYLAADIHVDSTSINYGGIINLDAVIDGNTNPDNFIFRWMPSDLVTDSASYSTQSLPLVDNSTFILSIENIYGDCVSYDSLNITVNGEELYASVHTSDSIICENNNAQLFAEAFEGTGNYTYQWTPSEGLDAADIANPTFTPYEIFNIADTINFVCAISDGITTVHDSVMIVIYDHLVADAGNDYVTINYGEQGILQANVGDANTNNFIFNWSPGELVIDSTSYNTLTVPLGDSTTFVLSVNNRLGECISYDTINFIINGKPVSAFAYSNDTLICENQSAQLYVEANEGTGNYTYRWHPSEGLDSDTIYNPIFTYDSIIYDTAQIFNFYCEVSDGITTVNTNELSVVIYRSPDAVFANDSIISYCVGSEITFNVPENVACTSYLWTITDEDGTSIDIEDPTAMTLTHLFEEEGDYIVTLTATISDGVNGCESTHSVIIDIISAPDVLFYPENYFACAGEEFYFSAPENPEGTSYVWHVIDTAGVVLDSITNSEFAYSIYQIGEYTLSLTASFGEGENSCSDTYSIMVYVNETPDAVFSDTDTSICADYETIFYAPQNSEGTTYQWSVIGIDGEPLIIEDPNLDSLSFVFNDVGIHTVILTATLGNCSSTHSIDVDVLYTPDVFFSDDLGVCSNTPIDFYAPENLEGTSYNWTISLEDEVPIYTSDNDTLTYSFTNLVNYIVTLDASYGQDDTFCENEHSITVTVFRSPEASIELLNIVENDSIANGIPYGNVAILSGSAGADTDTTDYVFQWEPADLLVNPNAAITQTKYPLIVPHIFTLTVTSKINGECQDSTQDTVRIIGNEYLINDTICDDGASYVDGRYWLFDEDGWDFYFPGHYTGLGEHTFNPENGDKMKVRYDITLLNKFIVPEIGNGLNAEIVYHFGMGHDLYKFSIENVTGGGTDEDIVAFNNVEAIYDWSIQMIEGSEWTFEQSNTNSITINVMSEGSAYIECWVSSLCSTERRWMLIYTPGHRPCDDPTYLNVDAVSGNWAHVNWQTAAERCIVQYSTDENFFIYEEINTTAKNITLDRLFNSTTYYWRVASVCEIEGQVFEPEFVYGEPFTTQEEGIGLGEENSTNDILMYPNPTYDNVIIEGENIYAIEFYNFIGVQVYKNNIITEKATTINTNNMSRGLYIVRIIMKDGRSCSKRLVVE